MVGPGVTSNTEKRLVFGPGTLWRDFGEVYQRQIGATRGGAIFKAARDDRTIPLDGARGVSKQLRRTVDNTATLEVTLVEFSKTALEEILRGTGVLSQGFYKVPGRNALAATDWWDNLTLVAEVSENTQPVVIRLVNSLIVGGWQIAVGNLDEGTIPLVFQAHYTVGSYDVPPYEIWWPTIAGETTPDWTDLFDVMYGLVHDWHPGVDQGGQVLRDLAGNADGQLGSTSGADTADPAWQSSPPALSFDGGDYVAISGSSIAG